jgi:hypothetical protein
MPPPAMLPVPRLSDNSRRLRERRPPSTRRSGASAARRSPPRDRSLQHVHPGRPAPYTVRAGPPARSSSVARQILAAGAPSPTITLSAATTARGTTRQRPEAVRGSAGRQGRRVDPKGSSTRGYFGSMSAEAKNFEVITKAKGPTANANALPHTVRANPPDERMTGGRATNVGLGSRAILVGTGACLVCDGMSRPSSRSREVRRISARSSCSEPAPRSASRPPEGRWSAEDRDSGSQREARASW